MRKLLAIILAATMLLTIVACKKQTKPGPVTQPSPTQATPTDPSTQPGTEGSTPSENPTVLQKPMYAISLVPQTETATDSNNTVRFKYTHQNISLVLPEPEVADRIILDYLNRMDRADQYAQTLRTEILRDEYKDSGVPFMYNVSYTPMRFDSMLLSMLETDIEYMGWIHPNDYSHGVTYDLLTGETLKLSDVLCDNVTVESIAAAAISKVSSQDGLWPNYDEIIQDSFVVGLEKYDCWYFSENGLCFCFDPYLLAPYAAGPITIEIPYEALLGTLRDEYFPAEKDTYKGNLIAKPFTADSFGEFTQFSEVVLVENGTKILLSAENAITNISIQTIDKNNVNGPTVMAVQSLTPGDAIMIEFDPNTTKLLINYLSNGEYVAKSITVNGNSITIS